MRISSRLHNIIFGLIIFLVVIFFYKEISFHWIQLSNENIKLHFGYLFLALLLVLAAYLAATLGWKFLIFKVCNKRLTFSESIGFVNISQISKYIPGKLWSYALQVHLLAVHQVPKTLVLSVNLIMLLSLVMSATLLGLGNVLYSGGYLPNGLAIFLFGSLLCFYLFLILGGSWSINLTIRFVNIFLNEKIKAFELSIYDSIRAHFLFLISNILFGSSGYYVAIGLGFHGNFKLFFPILSIVLFADSIGFLAFIVPGGLGVREGLIYAMLKPLIDLKTCFLLPFVFRLVTMVGDLLLGGISLFLLKSFNDKVRLANEAVLLNEE